MRDDAEPDPDVGAVRGRVQAEYPQLAVGHRRHGGDHAPLRGRAGPGGAEETEDLTLAHLEVDRVDGQVGAEALW